MVYTYAKELQGNTDKYVMKYISEIVKLAFQRNLISLEDLYFKEEKDICNIFDVNFSSWKIFRETDFLVRIEKNNGYFLYFI